MAASFKVKIKGFKTLEDITGKKFPKRFKRNVSKGTKRNALLAEAAIKLDINAGKFTANSSMTKTLKGSSRPLVDSGELVKSINGVPLKWDEFIVGVLKSRNIRDPDTGAIKDILQIASVLHNGAVITVTQKMRDFFGAMHSKSLKGETTKPWMPIRASTQAIVIPKRPFLESAVNTKRREIYKKNWQAAIDKSMRGK
jgi:hypothetical protein